MIDALVIGRSLPGLLAALELAEVGLRVAVAGGPLELPEGPERDAEGSVSALLTRIATPIDPDAPGAVAHPAALPREVVPPTPRLLDRAGRWAPQPTPSVLGIPAVPLAAEVLRLLGTGGALRAFVDRFTPLLTIGKTRSFGQLVRRRLGDRACEVLVEPLVRERYGVAADEVDVAVAAPGLSETLSRAGSLTAAALAYSERNAAREAGVEPAEGWKALASALTARLSLYGVEMLGPAALDAEWDGERWHVAIDGDSSPTEARALVLDPHGARTSELRALLRERGLAPSRLRIYAEIDIHRPDDLGEAVGVRQVGDWALRIVPSATGGKAFLSGPSCASSDTPPVEPDRRELEALAQAAGIRPVADAGWRLRVGAAPPPTLDERHRAADALSVAVVEEPELLPVGSALHGAELSAALLAARDGATALRRRLLGLSD